MPVTPEVTGIRPFRIEVPAPEEKASTEAVALAHLVRGVQW
jgi:hypothetical protein